MTHLYGHRWTSVYGSATRADGALSASAAQWLYDLAEYTPDEVALGLKAVAAKRLEWPPGPIEFMNLCDGVPTVAEVLDRKNDYGPVCAALRARMDWWNLDQVPTKRLAEAVGHARDRALTVIRRDGTLDELKQQQRAAIGVQREAIGN